MFQFVEFLRSRHRRSTAYLCSIMCCAVLLPLVGCREQPQIEHYRVKKDPPAPPIIAHDQPRMPPPQAKSPAEIPFAFEKPASWQSGAAKPFTRLVFAAKDSGVEVTVSDLPAQGMGGDLLANINRWRKQVALGDLTADELKSAIKPLKFGDIEGHYVELFGPADAQPRKAIAGAIVIHGEIAWYFKLIGDAPGVEQERDRFNAFLKSIQFK